MASNRTPTRTPRPSISFPLAPPPHPAKFLASPSSTRSRLVEVQTLALVIYHHQGDTYVRILPEDDQIHLIDVQTRKPLQLTKNAPLTPKAFERMLAEKRIIRRLCLSEPSGSNAALGQYFKAGHPLGEFVMVNTVKFVPTRHKPFSNRPSVGRRYKRPS